MLSEKQKKIIYSPDRIGPVIARDVTFCIRYLFYQVECQCIGDTGNGEKGG